MNKNVNIEISYFDEDNNKIKHSYDLEKSDGLINFIENDLEGQLDKAVGNTANASFCWVEIIVDPTYGIETDGKLEAIPFKIKVRNTEENFKKIENSPWIKSYKKITFVDEDKELKEFRERCQVNFKEINDVVNITCVIVKSLVKNDFMRKHFIENNYNFTDDMFAHFALKREESLPIISSYDTVKNILTSLASGNGDKSWLRRLKSELEHDLKEDNLYEITPEVVITNMYK